MSLHSDRVLSQTWRYAQHRKGASTRGEELASLDVFVAFRAQFDETTQGRMSSVYYTALNGRLFEDKRSRGVTYR